MNKKKWIVFILICLFLIASIILINFIQDRNTALSQKSTSNEDQKEIENIKNYIDENEEDTSAHLELGVRYFLEEQYEDAIIEYQKVIEREPENSLAWHRLTLVNIFQNDFKEAYENRKKTIELDPKAAFYISIASLEVILDKPTLALENAKKALELAKKAKEENIEHYQEWVDQIEQFNAEYTKGNISESYLGMIKSNLYFDKPIFVEMIEMGLAAEDITKEQKQELIELKEKVKSHDNIVIKYEDLSSVEQ
ncbi:tetratricopeptide repeat protein [Saliterribacillus persicus]|uniref:Uncharacterized protein n=1 Tax=Saliterribacillus persicus TaxID=930114 RepID=A0A368YC66_9BACI|nr:hypothetical protein [Saliterribacillus persicus]RCW76936.1 hypothetical protein DFR57_102211 [Saliterribacillus persicus]